MYSGTKKFVLSSYNQFVSIIRKWKTFVFPSTCWVILLADMFFAYCFFGIAYCLPSYLPHKFGVSFTTASVIMHIYLACTYSLPPVFVAYLADNIFSRIYLVYINTFLLLIGSILVLLGYQIQSTFSSVWITSIGLMFCIISSGTCRVLNVTFAADTHSDTAYTSSRHEIFNEKGGYSDQLFLLGDFSSTSHAGHYILPKKSRDLTSYTETLGSFALSAIMGLMVLLVAAVFMKYRVTALSKHNVTLEVMSAFVYAVKRYFQGKEVQEKITNSIWDYAYPLFPKHFLKDVYNLSTMTYLCALLAIPYYCILFQLFTSVRNMADYMDPQLGSATIPSTIVPLIQNISLSLTIVALPIVHYLVISVLRSYSFILEKLRGFPSHISESFIPKTPRQKMATAMIICITGTSALSITSLLVHMETTFKYPDRALLFLQEYCFLPTLGKDWKGNGYSVYMPKQEDLDFLINCADHLIVIDTTQGGAYFLFMKKAQDFGLIHFEYEPTKGQRIELLAQKNQNIFVFDRERLITVGNGSVFLEIPFHETPNYTIRMGNNCCQSPCPSMEFSTRGRIGGKFVLFVNTVNQWTPNSERRLSLQTVVFPNFYPIYLLIVPLILIGICEAMLVVTGRQVCYAYSPESMKTIIQSMWILFILVGNVIDIGIVQIPAPYNLIATVGVMVVCLLLFLYQSSANEYLNLLTESSETKEICEELD